MFGFYRFGWGVVGFYRIFGGNGISVSFNRE